MTGSVKGADKDKDVLTYTATDPPPKASSSSTTPLESSPTPPVSQARHAAATGDPAAKTDTFTVTVDDGHGGTVAVPSP